MVSDGEWGTVVVQLLAKVGRRDWNMRRNPHQFSAMMALPRKSTFFLPRLVRPWRVARVLGMEERSLDFWRVRPIIDFYFYFGRGEEVEMGVEVEGNC
jgi:hypothetical protein